MRRRLFYPLPVFLLGCLILGSPAAAQGELTPEDEEVVSEFFAELGDQLGVLPEEAFDIMGEPGDKDLAPGFSVFLGDEATEVSADFPDGGESSLVGPCLGIAASFAPADGGGFELLDVAADFSNEGTPLDLRQPIGDDGTYAQAFTSGNPFTVHVNGFVVYAGRTETPPIDHTWFIDTQGISLDSGGDDNPGAEDRNAGSVNLKDDLPAGAKVNALFRISGEMTANEGTFECAGAGYFKTIGGSRTLEGVGYVLVLAFGLGALFNARPAQTWKG
ncbi:MAG: hypothetical protein GY929_15615 [Actinomycetia bacterium]|nr:hypothetical protein [Actinomycetes bacterium]